MALENIRAEDGNVCTDRTHSRVATFSTDEQAVLEKNKSTGAVEVSWPTDTLFTDVFSLEFDGYYWWTLERQDGAITVRKWEKDSGIFAKLVTTYSFSSEPVLPIDAQSMAIEYNTTTVDIPAGPAVNILSVDDASNFILGDDLVIGPSTAGGYTDNYDKVTITNIDDNDIHFSPALSNRFNSGNAIYSPRAIWVVNDGGDVEDNGSLIKYSAKTGALLAVDYHTLYKNVSAATYYQGKLLFVKGNQVFWVTPSSFSLFKVMAIDNLRSDRSSLSTVYDLYGYGDFIYRLQREATHMPSLSWITETWSTYNLVSSTTVPEVYMIAVSVDRSVMHAVSPPVVPSNSSQVICYVYDQYFTPVFGKTVDFSADKGSLTSIQEVTDTNGFCTTVYNADTSLGLVTVTAST